MGLRTKSFLNADWLTYFLQWQFIYRWAIALTLHTSQVHCSDVMQLAKSWKNSFYITHSKQENKPFLAKNVTAKVKFQSPEGLACPVPLLTSLNKGHYLWSVERRKRFVKVHLHCIVSNLKHIRKMSMLSPVETFPRPCRGVNFHP